VRQRGLETGRETETGQGFRVAAEALGSKARRVTTSVYDLSPELVGMFDLVHVGDLLLHLRDPVRAIERIRSVTAGTALIVSLINKNLVSQPGRFLVEYQGGWSNTIWWQPSLDTLAQMVIDGGFADVTLKRLYRLDLSYSEGDWRAILVARP
jgi:tRNA (mo5U34)-methyltransferase